MDLGTQHNSFCKRERYHSHSQAYGPAAKPEDSKSGAAYRPRLEPRQVISRKGPKYAGEPDAKRRIA